MAYTAIALAFAWPLPLHLSTHLTGPLDSDAGVYVWNQWIFHREVVDRHSTPYFTDAILSFTGRANLSLHNYTVLANLLALPLIGPLGLITAFNITYLLLSVLTAYTMFLLGRQVVPDAPMESWLAGVLFAWSPMLITRSSQHFSLVAAAPLPLFVILLLRTQERRRASDAALLGACVAVAMFGDVYYSVYCAMLAGAFLLSHGMHIRRLPSAGGRRRLAIRSLEALIICMASLVIAIAITGGWELSFPWGIVRMRTLYTPVLVLTVMLAVRLLLPYRAHLEALRTRTLIPTARLAVIAGLVAGVLLSPMLYALGTRIAQGGFDQSRIFWRSSPAGVDVLAFLVPNPNHPLAPRALFTWLEQPMMAFEHVASVPLVAMIVIVGALCRGWRPPRLWLALGATFALLALGPFVHVAGVNTYIPGPWALVRYLPVVGLARTPARLVVVVMLVVSILFVLGLRELRRHYGRPVVMLITVVLLVELLPAPRILYSAAVPAIYHTIAGDPRTDIRVLELPYGVSTGTGGVGRYSARAQFGQTVHGKAIAGGTLSRVSSRRIADMKRQPIVSALLRLSEGETLSPREIAALTPDVPLFVERVRLGYVVIDRSRLSTESTAAAIGLLQLQHVASDGAYELYRPSRPTLRHD